MLNLHPKATISRLAIHDAPATSRGRVATLRLSIIIIGIWCTTCNVWPADSLYSLFGVDMPPGDILILIDGSGSMGGDYPLVRQQVVEFVSSLTGSEQVCVYLFGRETGQALAGPGDRMGPIAEQRIPAETLPGTGTDIGLALHKGVQWLKRDGASATQTLFLLTDGYHQPPPDSPFGSDHEVDPDWQQLRRSGRELADRSRLSVYGLGLSQQTDIELLRYVFPVENTEIVVRSASDTGSLLNELRESLRRGRLQRTVERELEAYSVSVTTKPREGTLPALQLHNDYPHLPVILSEVRVSNVSLSDGAPVTSQQVTIKPVMEAEGLTVLPRSSATVELRAELPHSQERNRLFDYERRYTLNCTVLPVLGFAADASGLDLQRPWVPKVEPVTVSATLVEPVAGLWSRYWWAAAAGALLLLIVWAVWARVRPERLTVDGELLYTVGEAGTPRKLQLEGYRKSRVTVGPAGPGVDVALGGLPAGSGMGFRIEARGKWSMEVVSISGHSIYHKGRAVQTISLKNGTRFRVGEAQFEYVNQRLSREM